MAWRGLAVGLAVVSCGAVPAAAQSAPPRWFKDLPDRPLTARPAALSISCTVPASPAKPAKPAKPAASANQPGAAAPTNAATYTFDIYSANGVVIETDDLSPGGIRYSNESLREWDPHFPADEDRSRRFVSVSKDAITWGYRLVKEEGGALDVYSAYLAVYDTRTHKLTERHATAGRPPRPPYVPAVPPTYDEATYSCTEKKG
jgi:hypothetical protein